MGGIALALFKLSYRYKCTWKNETNDINVRKKAIIKMSFSLLAGILCGISCTLWIAGLWIHDIGILKYLLILLILPLVLMGFCMPILVGLGKTVEAGAPSVTGTLKSLIGEDSHKSNIKITDNVELERRSEAEIKIIKKRLKQSSYNLTMPISVFVLSFAALYGALGDKPNSLTIIMSASLLAFGLTYLIQILNGRSFAGSSSGRICDKCFKKDYIGLKQCACGGIYEPAVFYKLKENSEQV